MMRTATREESALGKRQSEHEEALDKLDHECNGRIDNCKIKFNQLLEKTLMVRRL